MTVSCQEQEVLSSNWCRVHQFLFFPIHGHPLGKNRRLGLKASSPYCRLVVGSPCLLIQGIFTWKKLTRVNQSFFGTPGAEAQIIHVRIRSPGCIQLAGESMQCFQDVWTQVPLITNLTEGIPEHILLKMSLRRLILPLQRIHLSCRTQ